MIRISCTLLTFIFLAFLPVQAQTRNTVKINGSGSCLDMLQPITAAYANVNNKVHIDIGAPLGSAGSIKALMAGAIDVAVVSRPLSPDEIKNGCELRPYGKTPMTVVVHKNIIKKNITTEELENIYAGKITQWDNGVKIRIVLRPAEDIDSKILQGLSAGMRKCYAEAKSRHGMLTATTDPEAYNLIEKTPGGFGTTALVGILVHRLKLNIISLNGVSPDIGTLSRGSYPMAKEISFVTMPNTSREAKAFIDFIYSPRGKSIAREYGVIAVRD